MRQILEHNMKREQRRGSNKKKKQNEEFDECSIPPVPPRTSDMHILVFPENTQAYLGTTGSNTCTVIATVECSATSHEAMSAPNNILPSKLQGASQVSPDQSSNPEVVSVCSAGTPPPIPPHSDGMLQLPQQSLEPTPDIVRSKGNHFSWLTKLGIGRKGTQSSSTNSTVYPPSGTVDRDTFNIEMKYNLAYQHTELLAM